MGAGKRASRGEDSNRGRRWPKVDGNGKRSCPLRTRERRTAENGIMLLMNRKTDFFATTSTRGQRAWRKLERTRRANRPVRRRSEATTWRLGTFGPENRGRIEGLWERRSRAAKSGTRETTVKFRLPGVNEFRTQFV